MKRYGMANPTQGPNVTVLADDLNRRSNGHPTGTQRSLHACHTRKWHFCDHLGMTKWHSFKEQTSKVTSDSSEGSGPQCRAVDCVSVCS